uniref:Uncharacterized protein n=1 Tax=Setaria italica TaxID=4555 RepID=K3ZPP0_SETIT
MLEQMNSCLPTILFKFLQRNFGEKLIRRPTALFCFLCFPCSTVYSNKNSFSIFPAFCKHIGYILRILCSKRCLNRK